MPARDRLVLHLHSVTDVSVEKANANASPGKFECHTGTRSLKRLQIVSIEVLNKI